MTSVIDAKRPAYAYHRFWTYRDPYVEIGETDGGEPMPVNPKRERYRYGGIVGETVRQAPTLTTTPSDSHGILFELPFRFILCSVRWAVVVAEHVLW
jgi:hypothetical protein